MKDSQQRTAKPEEFIRVYDMLLQVSSSISVSFFIFFFDQYIADLIAIPGLDEDLEVQKEMAAHTFKFKAFRCYYLAQSYVANSKWPEAMALYDRTLDHESKAISHYREWAGPGAQVKCVGVVVAAHVILYRRGYSNCSSCQMV